MTIPFVILDFSISLKLKPLPVISLAPSFIKFLLTPAKASDPVKFFTCCDTKLEAIGIAAFNTVFAIGFDVIFFKLSKSPFPECICISSNSSGWILTPFPVDKFLFNFDKFFLAL